MTHDGTEVPIQQVKQLGRYLGPDLNVGDALTGTVLTEKAQTLSRTSIIPLKPEELHLDSVKQQKEFFTKTLTEKLKERVQAMGGGKSSAELEAEQEKKWLVDDTPEHIEYEEMTPEELGYLMDPDEKKPLPELAEADDLNLNKYLSAKVVLPKDSAFAQGRVLRRARDADGELIGHSNDNPALDTSVYEVQFEDGSIERYHANIIAEHIYSQIDGEGYGRTLLDEIVDHKWDDSALLGEEGYKLGPNGERVPKETTKGWWLLAKLKDHSTQWFKLKDIKESNPLEVAQYAVDNQLVDEPAFKWWVPYTIRKRNRILKQMKNRYHRTHSKFGIEVPKTVKRALEIDKETNTTFWRDAIEKEMKTVMVAFDILPEGAERPVGRNYIGCHLVFDIKQGSLQRKVRFVADGHRTDVSDIPTYASVVSRDSVRIAFTLAELSMALISWQLTVRVLTSMLRHGRSSTPNVVLNLENTKADMH